MRYLRGGVALLAWEKIEGKNGEGKKCRGRGDWLSRALKRLIGTSADPHVPRISFLPD
jgi:hypothetical protein